MMVATPMYSFVRQRDCLANNLFLLHQVKHDEAHQCSSRSISISTSGVLLTDHCENPVVCLHRNDVYNHCACVLRTSLNSMSGTKSGVAKQFTQESLELYICTAMGML